MPRDMDVPTAEKKHFRIISRISLRFTVYKLSLRTPSAHDRPERDRISVFHHAQSCSCIRHHTMIQNVCQRISRKNIPFHESNHIAWTGRRETDYNLCISARAPATDPHFPGSISASGQYAGHVKSVFMPAAICLSEQKASHVPHFKTGHSAAGQLHQMNMDAFH